MKVSGTSGSQDELAAICGGYNRQGQNYPCEARIVREPSNPYDPNAVAVMIGETKIGYLPGEEAARVGSQMDHDGVVSAVVAAEIVGGWRTNQYDSGNFGVRLGIPRWGWIDFGVGATPPPPPPPPERVVRQRPAAASEGPLVGVWVAIVGAPSDGDLAKELAAAGAKIMAGVGKSTTLLVVAAERPFPVWAQGSSKYEKALQAIAGGQKMRVVSLSEARELARGSSA